MITKVAYEVPTGPVLEYLSDEEYRTVQRMNMIVKNELSSFLDKLDKTIHALIKVHLMSKTNPVNLVIVRANDS